MKRTVLPDLVTQGSKARLIPVLADTSKENRVTSVFLATLMAAQEFGSRMLGTIGQRVGSRAIIRCYTEVVLAKDPANLDRPDGLIVVTVGKRRWTALVEAKIGNAKQEVEQIERYLATAKQNKIDAVITISNQFAALPTHHPLKISKVKTRGVQLFHWSWMNILTQAVLQLDAEDRLDIDQRYILTEMARYFEHDSSGIKRFDRMNAEWKDVCTSVKSGGLLAKTSSEVTNTVGSWHQEQKDLCLILSRDLSISVSLRLSARHAKDPEQRLRDECQEFAQAGTLQFSLDIPDAAAPMFVTADMLRRTLSCSMKVLAPGDKKSAKARINWILRQLSGSEPDNIYVKAIWPRRTLNTMASLQELRENPNALAKEDRKLTPAAFEILSVHDLAGKFSAPRKFVEELEKIVPSFYKHSAKISQTGFHPHRNLKSPRKRQNLTCSSPNPP